MTADFPFKVGDLVIAKGFEKKYVGLIIEMCPSNFYSFYKIRWWGPRTPGDNFWSLSEVKDNLIKIN